MTPPPAPELNVAVPVITGLPVWSHSAVMAVVPVRASTARPEELIVATPTSLDTHFRLGEFVMSWVAGVIPLKVPMAMY